MAKLSRSRMQAVAWAASMLGTFGACSGEDASGGGGGGGGAGGLDPISSGGTAAQGGTAAIVGGGAVGTAGVGVGVVGASGAGGEAGSAAAAGRGGSGPAAELTPEDLFPLAVGNRWTYRVTTTIPDSSPCPAGEHATEILGEGREGFEAKHVCDALMPSAVRFYAHTDRGLESLRCPMGAAGCTGLWAIGLPRPIVDGAMFNALEGARVLRRVGRVSVEAGTFDECWETRGMDDAPLVSVYCVGVGAVAFSQKDEVAVPPWIDYSLELTSFVVE